MKYDPIIPKEQLEAGAYYKGRCRNATVARWDGEKFVHWRFKFGRTFLESINAPEDEKFFDVFVAEQKLDSVEKEIPLPYYEG